MTNALTSRQSNEFQRTFERVYEDRLWIDGSGEGSLPENTQAYRQFLQTFLREKNIRSVLDVGCGDWMFSKTIDWSNVSYTGMDVVPSVIEKNQRTFGRPNITFLHRNILESSPPFADLLIMKDVLQHWPNALIQEALPIIESFPHALITNDVGIWTNVDIPLGSYRGLDITREPFNVPAEEVLAYPWYSPHHRLWFVKRVYLHQRDQRPS